MDAWAFFTSPPLSLYIIWFVFALLSAFSTYAAPTSAFLSPPASGCLCGPCFCSFFATCGHVARNSLLVCVASLAYFSSFGLYTGEPGDSAVLFVSVFALGG